MYTKPKFIQGIFSFEGSGLDTPSKLGPTATYKVPADKRAQIVYLRAGNSADALICIALKRDDQLTRYFPVGARQSIHIPMVVTEDVFPESKIELLISAPKGIAGTVIIDLGLIEVD
jgi:hypothetical protein